MKKPIWLYTILLLLLVVKTNAQTENTYEDLLILYVDEDYEKLLSKATKYTENDKTRKDPAPFLYVSKAYFEMSRDEQYAEKYPADKALRDALKWAAKYRRKDRDGSLYDVNEMYFEELKKVAVAEGAAQISDQNYSRAKRFYDSITDFDPSDPGAWLMLGYCQVQIRANTEATMSFKSAGEALASKDLESLNEVELELLKSGVIEYAQYLKGSGMRDSAVTLLDMAKPAFEEDPEFKLVYSEIN